RGDPYALQDTRADDRSAPGGGIFESTFPCGSNEPARDIFYPSQPAERNHRLRHGLQPAGGSRRNAMKPKKSELLFRKSQEVFAGGVNSPVRSFKAVGGIPRFIVRGQ